MTTPLFRSSKTANYFKNVYLEGFFDCSGDILFRGNFNLDSSSVSLGSKSLVGDNSISIGLSAGNTKSNNSISIGTNAGKYNIGNKNIMIGYYSSSRNIINTGSDNVFIGTNNYSIYNSSISNSIAIGKGSKIEGNNSISIGYFSIADGDNSIAIGNSSISGPNQITLGTINNETVRLNTITPLYNTLPVFTPQQIGYTFSSTISFNTIVTYNTKTLIATLDLPIGIWSVTALVNTTVNQTPGAFINVFDNNSHYYFSSLVNNQNQYTWFNNVNAIITLSSPTYIELYINPSVSTELTNLTHFFATRIV